MIGTPFDFDQHNHHSHSAAAAGPHRIPGILLGEVASAGPQANLDPTSEAITAHNTTAAQTADHTSLHGSHPPLPQPPPYQTLGHFQSQQQQPARSDSNHGAHGNNYNPTTVMPTGYSTVVTRLSMGDSIVLIDTNNGSQQTVRTIPRSMVVEDTLGSSLYCGSTATTAAPGKRQIARHNTISNNNNNSNYNNDNNNININTNNNNCKNNNSHDDMAALRIELCDDFVNHGLQLIAAHHQQQEQELQLRSLSASPPVETTRREQEEEEIRRLDEIHINTNASLLGNDNDASGAQASSYSATSPIFLTPSHSLSASVAIMLMGEHHYHHGQQLVGGGTITARAVKSISSYPTASTPGSLANSSKIHVRGDGLTSGGCAAGPNCPRIHAHPAYIAAARSVKQEICCAAHNCVLSQVLMSEQPMLRRCAAVLHFKTTTSTSASHQSANTHQQQQQQQLSCDTVDNDRRNLVGIVGGVVSSCGSAIESHPSREGNDMDTMDTAAQQQLSHSSASDNQKRSTREHQHQPPYPSSSPSSSVNNNNNNMNNNMNNMMNNNNRAGVGTNSPDSFNSLPTQLVLDGSRMAVTSALASLHTTTTRVALDSLQPTGTGGGASYSRTDFHVHPRQHFCKLHLKGACRWGSQCSRLHLCRETVGALCSAFASLPSSGTADADGVRGIEGTENDMSEERRADTTAPEGKKEEHAETAHVQRGRHVNESASVRTTVPTTFTANRAGIKALGINQDLQEQLRGQHSAGHFAAGKIESINVLSMLQVSNGIFTFNNQKEGNNNISINPAPAGGDEKKVKVYHASAPQQQRQHQQHQPTTSFNDRRGRSHQHRQQPPNVMHQRFNSYHQQQQQQQGYRFYANDSSGWGNYSSDQPQRPNSSGSSDKPFFLVQATATSSQPQAHHQYSAAVRNPTAASHISLISPSFSGSQQQSGMVTEGYATPVVAVSQPNQPNSTWMNTNSGVQQLYQVAPSQLVAPPSYYQPLVQLLATGDGGGRQPQQQQQQQQQQQPMITSLGGVHISTPSNHHHVVQYTSPTAYTATTATTANSSENRNTISSIEVNVNTNNNNNNNNNNFNNNNFIYPAASTPDSVSVIGGEERFSPSLVYHQPVLLSQGQYHQQQYQYPPIVVHAPFHIEQQQASSTSPTQYLNFNATMQQPQQMMQQSVSVSTTATQVNVTTNNNNNNTSNVIVNKYPYGRSTATTYHYQQQQQQQQLHHPQQHQQQQPEQQQNMNIGYYFIT